MFRRMYKDGEINYCETMKVYRGDWSSYKGGVNKEGKATGYGKYENKTNDKTEGTFVNDRLEGIAIDVHLSPKFNQVIAISQYYEGLKNGWATYYVGQKIINVLYEDDREKDLYSAVPKDVFFSKEGKPMKSLFYEAEDGRY